MTTSAAMGSNEDDGSMTVQQQMALAICPKFTSFLSIAGSFLISYQILFSQRRERLAKPYHRLVLGMSICDMMASTAWFFTTWPIPSTTPMWGASGSIGTCTAQGFFAQFSIATVMYNASLSTYYTIVTGVLRVKQKRAIDTIGQVEPLLHLNALIWGLGTAVASVSLELFNSVGWDCWIGSEPPGCIESWRAAPGETGTCTRGDNATLYIWVFYYIPLWIVIVYATLTMSIINARIRRTERRNGVSTAVNNEECSDGILQVGNSMIASNPSRSRVRSTSLVSVPGGEGEEHKTTHLTAEDAKIPTIKNCTNQGSIEDAVAEARQADPEGLTQSALTVRTGVGRGGRSGPSKRKKHSRKVAQQSLYYLGVFYVTWFWPSVFQIYFTVTGALGLPRNFRTVFALNLVNAIFVPIQGFLNLLVYQRPAYSRYRRSNPQGNPIKCWFITLGQELGYLSHSKEIDLQSALSSLQHMPVVTSRGHLPEDFYNATNDEDLSFSDDHSLHQANIPQNRQSDESNPSRDLDPSSSPFSWFRGIGTRKP